MALKTSIVGLEVRLVRFFLENIVEQFSIRELARRTKTDYKRVHATIQKLAYKNVVVKNRQANVDLCSLNVKGSLSTVYYVETLRTQEFLEKHAELRAFFSAIQEKINCIYYSLVVFGSFAKGKETKTSDVDLLIITPTQSVGEEIERIVNNEALLLGRKVQAVVLDEKEFVKNLSSRKVNVVVEAFKNHVIIAGIDGFYNGVKRAI